MKTVKFSGSLKNGKVEIVDVGTLGNHKVKSSKGPYGKVILTKVDESDGKKLSGAVFEVIDDEGVLWGRMTTNSKGRAESGKLPVARYAADGKFEELIRYSIREFRPPDGYALDATKKEVSFKYVEGTSEDDVQELQVKVEDFAAKAGENALDNRRG